MVSLRLSLKEMRRLTAIASRHGMTRSEWLRRAIEDQIAAADAVIDSHAIYLEVTGSVAGVCGSGRADGAHQHSRLLKQKLHAGRRR